MSAGPAGAGRPLTPTPVPAGPGATGERGLREGASRPGGRGGLRPCRPKSVIGAATYGTKPPYPGRVAVNSNPPDDSLGEAGRPNGIGELGGSVPVPG